MVTDPNEIIGKAVDSDVYAGDYITSGALINPEDVDIFSTMDLSNYRQIAIEVSRQSAVGGNIASGDTIDLAYIASTSAEENGETVSFTYTTTFMKDVLVYKVLTSTGEEYVNTVESVKYDEDGNKISNTPSLVILAVTADQAEEIIARQNSGTIKIVGRFDTSEDTDTTGYVMGDYGKVYTYYANPEE
jgi:pilus assembly protein CpaB